MFAEKKVGYSSCKQKVNSFRGQASWVKMSPGACNIKKI